MDNKNNGRVDVGQVFAGMIGLNRQEPEAQAATNPVVQPKTQAEAVPAKSGRKASKEKKIQVSIYLTPDMAKELRLQDAEKEKESDKSAIARTGIEIALALSNEEYRTLKAVAEQRGTTAGQIVKDALQAYL